jgi:hypothetical protein
MHGTSTRENREALPVPDPKLGAGRSRKVMSHNLDMNAGRESDGCVVCAEQREGSGGLKSLWRPDEGRYIQRRR